jgi:hypothetical protein
MKPADGFDYTRHGLDGRGKRLQRLFEILPGAASLGLLGGLVALAWCRPLWALVFVIVFDSFFICYLSYILVLLALSSFRLGIERHTDWMARIRDLDGIRKSGAPPVESSAASPGRRLSEMIYHRRLRQLRASCDDFPRSETIHHVVIVPVTSESREVIDQSLRSLLAQSFPSDRTMVMLAIEENAGRRAHKAGWDLHREYYERFLALYVAPHRADADSGEEIHRAVNVSTAARMAAQALRERDIPLDCAIVTCLEPSAVPEPQYLACVAWHFMTCPRRQRTAFQPVPAYYGKVWDAPDLARVLHVGTSFSHLIDTSDPEKLVTFSSHSMSLRTLAEVGYWPADMVSSDASLFWKCYLRFAGDYRMMPMQIPLWLDIPHDGSLQSAVRGVYREHRRWAWGIENFPIILRGFIDQPAIPLIHKLRHATKLMFNSVVPATVPFVVFVLGWLPAVFAAVQSSSSIAVYNTARIQSIVMGFVGASLTIAAAISLFLLPFGRMKRPVRQLGGYLLSWLLFPVFAILFNALPALGAQVRLMFGQYNERR